MRALCGAIITAGSLIGLGLAVIGFGTRYQAFLAKDSSALVPIRLGQMDTALSLSFIVLILSVLIGMGISFLGLAYHHERRHHERLHAAAHMKSAHDIG